MSQKPKSKSAKTKSSDNKQANNPLKTKNTGWSAQLHDKEKLTNAAREKSLYSQLDANNSSTIHRSSTGSSL